MTFEWHSLKAEENIKKHNISFEEASSIFGDILSYTVVDSDHSLGEERFITIGQAVTGKFLIVSHTERKNKIRIISARAATKKERRFYEKYN